MCSLDNMTSYQFNDLPQIPYTDGSTYAVWTNDSLNAYSQMGFRMTNVVEDDIDYNDASHHGIVSMQPMQRFLYGDAFPMSNSLLHAKLDRGMPLQAHHPRQYEQAWPSVDCVPCSPRNDSPDRTSVSTNSTYAVHNELQSPRAFYPAPYGSPGEFSQSSLPYSSAEYIGESKYISEVPLTDRSITLRDLEYQHQDPEAVAEEQKPEPEPEPVDLTTDLEYDQEPIYTKMEMVPDNYQSLSDSCIGNSLRDAESVQPMTLSDEEDSSSDYKPPTERRRLSSTASSFSNKNTQKRRGRKPSTASTLSNTPRVTKRARGSNVSPTISKASRIHSANSIDTETRPFPCPFAAYGCHSNFVSKNEWKRHVSTQHIKLGFWRCDLCTATADPNDDSIIYHNDFNRKDLFTQHLRRMHAAASSASRTQQNSGHVVSGDNIAQHQQRCYQTLRETPPKSTCLFCDREFAGPASWEERMEHVGRHLEKERKGNGFSLDPKRWAKDEVLERWLLDEGLVVMEGEEWKIGIGKPRRQMEESEQDLDTDD